MNRPWLLLCLLLLGGSPEALRAQETDRNLVFATEPILELWLHGMALVDPVGPGPHPLYDPAYPAQVRQRKASEGVYPTTLDQKAGYFREVFRRDPTFEVFHFLPLYFAGAGRTEIFLALESLAHHPAGIPRAPTPRTALGTAAVGSILTTSEQRAVLGEFLAALRSEWDLFFQDDWRRRAQEVQALNEALQEAWNRRYQPALRPLLAGLGMEGGTVALSPAIGAEGRVFGGLPQDPGDNVLVVAHPSGPERTREAVFSILRELSFPMVRQAVERWGEGPRARDEAEGLAAVAAVRSGALILETFLPEEAHAYREFFLSRLGRSAPRGAMEAAFREAYSLDSALETALRDIIDTTTTTGDIE